jgi:large subunit ribosomal protein L7/L12
MNISEEIQKKEEIMNIEQIIEAIKAMTVLELNELVKACEEEFGVSAAAPVAVVAAGGGEAAADEGKSEYDVVLKDAGSQKIAVIKAVKEATGLGLGEAKAIVDGAAPAEALAGLNDERFSLDAECASKLYVAYAPYTGE